MSKWDIRFQTGTNNFSNNSTFSNNEPLHEPLDALQRENLF